MAWVIFCTGNNCFLLTKSFTQVTTKCTVHCVLCTVESVGEREARRKKKKRKRKTEREARQFCRSIDFTCSHCYFLNPSSALFNLYRLIVSRSQCKLHSSRLFLHMETGRCCSGKRRKRRQKKRKKKEYDEEEEEKRKRKASKRLQHSTKKPEALLSLCFTWEWWNENQIALLHFRTELLNSLAWERKREQEREERLTCVITLARTIGLSKRVAYEWSACLSSSFRLII